MYLLQKHALDIIVQFLKVENEMHILKMMTKSLKHFHEEKNVLRI